jgi:WD40 repeat protein
VALTRATRLASAGGDGTVRIWRVPDAEELAVLGGRGDGYLNDVVFDPDGAHVATAGDDGVIRMQSVYPGSEPKLLRGHDDAVLSVVFSPDGAWLASAGDDDTVRLWETASGEGRVLGRVKETVEDLSFSPDNRRVALADGGMVRVFDVERRSRPVIVRGSQTTVLAMAFISDGSGIVAVWDDRKLRVWSPTGLAEALLPTPPLYVTADAEIGAGGLVATTGWSNANPVRLWRCAPCRPIDQVLALLRARAQREMTREERRTYLHE